MLTVAKVTGTDAAGYADYLEGKTTATAAGDYYLKDGERVEAPGRWVAGAAAVGCKPTEPVTGEQLRALMAVRRPDTGRALRPAGSTGVAVSALDATFSAPKSVSAVWALADPDLRAKVEAAHETAIDRTLHYAAAQVAMVRQRVDRQTVIHAKARELISTSWRHTTARAVDGPPDPQLHSHVLLHAAVRRDGQLAAIDSRAWLTHRRELGAAYRTELARELSQLGFQIRRGTGRGKRYFEIDGIPDQLLETWSSRHRQVQEAIQARIDTKRADLHARMNLGGPAAQDAQRRLRELEQTGLRAGEDRFLTHATRHAKQPVTRTELDHHWRTTAATHRLSAAALTRLCGAAAPMPNVDVAVLAARLTEHDAMLTHSQARAIALEHHTGLPIRDGLRALAQLRDDRQLLTLADQTLTTDNHRQTELETVAVAQRLAAGEVDRLPDPVIDRHAARLDQELRAHGGGLSAEQHAAFTLACGDSQLVLIEGQAGTGKSTVLIGVVRAHEDAGQQIIVTSTAALTAQRLADELTTAGAHPTAYSTAALTHATTTGHLSLDPATTIIHDEAALASTHELHALLDAAEDSGARVVLVGDPRQSQPVGAGGLWPHIHHATDLNDAHTRLTRNLRAHDPDDARAQASIRAGESLTALESYQDRGRVHLSDRQQEAEDAALDAAHDDRAHGLRTTVIVQASNDHLDQLNARAQAIRLQAGELGPQSLSLLGRPYELHSGDQIQVRATIPHPDLGQLRNGATATVAMIDRAAGTATMRFAANREATLTRDQLGAAQTRLAYVQHPFPAQGMTTDTTHFIAGEHATREGTYVALTRARHHTHIYAPTDRLDLDTPPLTRLAEHLSRSEPDLPSIALPLAQDDTISMEHANVTDLRSETLQEITPTVHADDTAPRTPTPNQQPNRPEAADPTPGRVDESGPLGPHRATAAIAAYRDRYGIAPDQQSPLGPPPAAGAFQQRLDRRRAAADAIADLHQQHHLSDSDRELQQQLRNAAHRHQDRTPGWEP